MAAKVTDKVIISDHLVAKLSQFVSGKLGLYFPEKRLDDLRDRVSLAAKEYGFNNTEDCIRWLLSTPLTNQQIETLSSCLTVGETHFFRDMAIYDSLERYVLPELIQLRRKQGKYLRIWSAGCSSGEEPYSIAILLFKMLPDIRDWDISIFATDINARSLEKAIDGIYKSWSFRSTPEWVRDRYFIKNREDSYSILPVIRNMVSFSYHNLATDPFPPLINNISATDIIFCRNVIMYFDPGLSKRIINLFYSSLPDGGWLIVSGSEGYLVQRSQFVTVVFPDTNFFRKDLSVSVETKDDTVKTNVSVYQQTNQSDSGVIPGVNFDLPEQTHTGLPDAVAINKPDKTDTPETKSKNGSEPDPLRQAVILYDKGNVRGAEDILTNYLLHDHKNTLAISLMAKICSDKGEFGKAVELCRKGIETDKCNPIYNFLLALIFKEQGKTGEAISSLKRAIYLDSDHALSFYVLGNILFQQGDRKNAIKYFNNALSILDRIDKEMILPGSDGLSAGRLAEIIKMKDMQDKTAYGLNITDGK